MLNSDLERDRFTVVLFYAVVLLISYLAFRTVAPFLVPLAWSAILAMVLHPVNSRLSARAGHTWAAVATTIGTSLIIVAPAVGVGALLVREVSGQIQQANTGALAAAAPEQLRHAWDAIRAQVPFLQLPADPTVGVQDTIKSAAGFIASRAAAILTNIASFVLDVFIMLFGLFFFLRDSTPIVSLIRRMMPFEAARRDRIVDQTHDLVVATVGTTFAVAIAQGTLAGITFGLLGFSAPIFWGVATSFASLVPLVGAGLIWAPAAIWLLLTGDVTRGVILLVAGAGLISTIDSVVRPVLLAGRTTMHGLLVFISLMGGVAAFGFIGLVLGPVVLAAMTTLLESVLKPKPGETASA